MIDSVTMIVPIRDGNTWYERVDGVTRADTSTYMANIENMRIYQHPTEIQITGSLAKYWNGNNVVPFSRPQVESAIRKIERETGIDLSRALVRSLEFGFCVQLSSPVSAYLRLMQNPNRYEVYEIGKASGLLGKGFKEIQTMGMKTRTGGIEFIMYDKSREARSHKQNMPAEYGDKNILRLEYKLKNRQSISAKFKRNLYAYDLFDSQVYDRLKEFHLAFYRTIPKSGRKLIIETLADHNPVVEKTKETGRLTPLQIMKLWAYIKRQESPDEYKIFIVDLAENGYIDKRNFAKIRTQSLKTDLKYRYSELDGLVLELDLQIRKRLEEKS